MSLGLPSPGRRWPYVVSPHCWVQPLSSQLACERCRGVKPRRSSPHLGWVSFFGPVSWLHWEEGAFMAWHSQGSGSEEHPLPASGVSQLACEFCILSTSDLSLMKSIPAPRASWWQKSRRPKRKKHSLAQQAELHSFKQAFRRSSSAQQGISATGGSGTGQENQAGAPRPQLGQRLETQARS